MNYLQQHQCFLTAAECLSFTEAAEKLYMSQSALSRNVAALETSLGVQLFNRDNNILTLTPGGRIIYDWMKKLEQTRYSTIKAAQRANQEPQRRLNVGAVGTEYPSERMSRSFSLFFSKYPDTELSLTGHHARTNIRLVQAGEMDIAFLMDAYGDTLYGLERLENRRYSRVMLMPLSHPMANGSIASLRDFQDDCFVSLSPEVSPTMTPSLLRLCGSCGFQPRIVEASGSREQMELVVSGRGVAVVPENHRCISDPMYRSVFLKDAPPLSSVCVWNPLNRNPALTDFLDIFRKTGD